MPLRDVIGHRKLVALLSRSIQHGTLPPSLVFAGPAGVGKRLTAVSAAQALNCLAPRLNPESQSLQLDACGTCTACVRISRGVHPDVPVIEPGDSGAIKIDVVRDVIDKSAYRPFEGRRRVVIVDQADALVPQAQNALLKTLEEPPPASVFILVTARPDALLPTVLSRCPRLRFRPLGPDDVAAVLMKMGRPEAAARAIAATADGSVARAAGNRGASDEEIVASRDIAVRVLAHIASTDDARRRIDNARDLLSTTGKGSGAADRDQLATHLRAMASLLRDVELLSTGGGAAALANPDVRPALEHLSTFQGDRGVRAFAAVDRALAALERNAGVKIVADWVLLNV